MLAKRIDLGSIPRGEGTAKTDIVKGRLVKMDPATFDVEYIGDGDEPFGFATLRIEVPAGGDIADHDVIPKGKKCVVYTLVENNVWATTEVDGIEDLGIGDELTPCTTADGAEKAGMLKKGTGTGKHKFYVYDIEQAGSYPLVAVEIR